MNSMKYFMEKMKYFMEKMKYYGQDEYFMETMKYYGKVSVWGRVGAEWSWGACGACGA